MINERAPNCQRIRNQTVAFMTNEMINRRVEKVQDEMTYLTEQLEDEKQEVEDKIAELEDRDTLTDKQSDRLDNLQERSDMLEQLIDALNIDLEEYYL